MSSDSNSVSSQEPLLEHEQNSFPQSGPKLKEAWQKGQTLAALSLAQQESTPQQRSPAPEDSEKHRGPAPMSSRKRRGPNARPNSARINSRCLTKILRFSVVSAE